MSTEALAIDLTEFEGDFAKPCHVKKCGDAARWAVLAAHTRDLGCPALVFYCDFHKERFTWEWVEWLVGGNPLICSRCRRPVSPLVGDNLKVMPL